MTNREPSDREKAVHESGHAVASFIAFQSPLPLIRSDEPMFISVTIEPECGSIAHCAPSELFFVENRDSDSLIWLIAAVAVFKAGQLAGRPVNCKKLPEDLYKNDNDQVEYLFRSTSPFNENKVLVVEAAECLVTTWFQTEFVFKAIDQLANELQRCRTLEWTECKRIIENSIGIPEIDPHC